MIFLALILSSFVLLGGVLIEGNLFISMALLIVFSVSTFLAKSVILAPIAEFEIPKKSEMTYRSFVLVKTTSENFPICLYKTGENEYTASLMKCTHRGCELNVGGGIYSCPCHGSEFDTKGGVLEGPADQDLKTFKTTIKNENIYIELS